MVRSFVMVAVVMAAGICSAPVPLTAAVDAVATHNAKVGGTVELLLKVTNTGPQIPSLGFVFRTADRWYDRHEMTEMSGCGIAVDAAAFACGDLGAGESRTFTFRGVATIEGTFHFEVSVRELVQPFDYVNSGDTHVWDEAVTS